MVFFAGFDFLAVFFWFMVPAYYCRALAVPRSAPQGVFNFSLDVEPFLKPGCPLHCPHGLLSDSVVHTRGFSRHTSANLYAADGKPPRAPLRICQTAFPAEALP